MDQRFKYKIGLVAASRANRWPSPSASLRRLLAHHPLVPGQAIVEETGLHAPVAGPPGEYVMTIQMYDAETLDLLPVSQAAASRTNPMGTPSSCRKTSPGCP